MASGLSASRFFGRVLYNRSWPQPAGHSMAIRTFSRTTRALGEDLRLWPAGSALVAILLACMWGMWFTTPSMPVYAATRQVRLETSDRLHIERMGQGASTRFETVAALDAAARFPEAERAAIAPGQPALFWYEDADGHRIAVEAVVASDWREDGRVTLHFADRPAFGHYLGDTFEVWVLIGHRSPLDRMLAGSGIGVESPTVTKGPAAR